MEKTADIVIIGGGVIGLSVAYQLALKKAGKIILLEKGQLGEGSTSRCVGGIRSQFSTEINIRFSLESMRLFDRFKEELGVDPEFKRIGYLFLATTEQETKVFKENVELQKKFDIPVEFLDTEEIKKRLQQFCKRTEVQFGAACVDRVSKILVPLSYPVEEILKVADEEDCDVIILGTHGKGLLKQTFLGSVSKAVLERTRKPVYIIPLPSEKTDVDWDKI